MDTTIDIESIDGKAILSTGCVTSDSVTWSTQWSSDCGLTWSPSNANKIYATTHTGSTYVSTTETLEVGSEVRSWPATRELTVTYDLADHTMPLGSVSEEQMCAAILQEEIDKEILAQIKGSANPWVPAGIERTRDEAIELIEKANDEIRKNCAFDALNSFVR